MFTLENFERQTEGLTALSVGGSLADCGECDLSGCDGTEGCSDKVCYCSEGCFSWSSCDTCGSGLGGDRQTGHAFATMDDGREVLIHLEVCVDCAMFIANGDLPND